MIGIRILFCLFLVNVGGANGVGEEADNSNGKKSDLLFGEMWRKAFEANRHNGKEREEMAKPKVKEEQKEEEMEKEEVAEEKSKRVKEEQKEEDEEENKLWKKMKTEPIEEERDGKKWQTPIKKEPKIEEKEWEELPETEEDSDQQQEEDDGSASDQSDSDQSADDDNEEVESESEKWAIVIEYEERRKEYKRKNKTKGQHHSKISRQIAKEMGKKLEEIYKWKKKIGTKNKPIINDETKLEIIKAYDKMRNESKMSGEYNSKTRNKIERKIAKELGAYRDQIYEWKKELIQKKKPESEEEKWEIIEQFDKMKNENKNKNGNRGKFEQKIARELGTCRNKIYKWKKELRRPENEEEKREIIKNFDKMQKEYKTKKEYKPNDRIKIEQKTARELGTCRSNIYKWRKELNQKKKLKSEEEKWEITEKFDKMRKEYQIRGNVERGDRVKIELEIAKELGTSRANIFKWKKERSQKSKPSEENEERKWGKREISNEEKLEIIEKFDKMRKEHKMKGDYKREDRNKIEEKIAKELGASRKNIYKWKREIQTQSESRRTN